MSFQIDDQVVHPRHGLGRIVGLVSQQFGGPEARLYYEIEIQATTIWVPVDGAPTDRLRPVTGKQDLDRYRAVLRGRPETLAADHRQRQLDVAGRLRAGLFLAACEVVRDLNARSWLKPLNEKDTAALRKTRDDLCREWAAADGVPLPDASDEVETLLRQGRAIFQTPPAPNGLDAKSLAGL